ncbi:hypothetical protein AB0J21_32310 [Streptomyces sp. NPDC049954]|uniref:hypothetical protein n=1 Tax=Streptomyces sp. NPDC049954 TaxID=3155779 RepID=UPI00343983FC
MKDRGVWDACVDRDPGDETDASVELSDACWVYQASGVRPIVNSPVDSTGDSTSE